MIRHLARVAAFCFAAALLTAHAATDIVVNTLDVSWNDGDGKCSLWEALNSANSQLQDTGDCPFVDGGRPYRVILQAGAHYIVNAPGPLNDPYYGPSFFLSQHIQVRSDLGYEPTITDFDPWIEVIGNGAVIERASGAPKFRFFFVQQGDLTLRDLTLRGGDQSGGPSYTPGVGGAILLREGVLSLDRVTFERNRADEGSVVWAWYLGTVNAISSTFADNPGKGQVTTAGRQPVNIANSTFSGPYADVVMFDLSTGPLTLSHNTMGIVIAGGTGASTVRGNIFTKGCYFLGSGSVTAEHNYGALTCPVILSDLGTLQPLAENGGATPTRGFIVPSPMQGFDPNCRFASNGTNPLFTNGAAIATDQRGVPRVAGACDAGAYQEGSVRMGGAALVAPQGLPYSRLLTGTGGTGPYSFEVVFGLPWLSLTNAGGNYSLTGIPPAGHGSTFDIVLKTIDANGVAGYGTYPIFIAAGVPYAPTLTGSTFDEGTLGMTVTFTPPPDDGGSPITGYVVRCTSGFQSSSSLTSPLVFTAPTGDSFNCGVVAINGVGSSPKSDATFSMSTANAVVSSLTRPGPSIIAPNQRAAFDITFSRPVTQLSADDFQVLATGTLTGNNIIDVTGSGTSYQVGVNSGTAGFGALTLNFIDVDSVFDSSLVPVAGPGIGGGDFAGPTYIVATAPSAPVITGVFAGYGTVFVQYTAANANGSPLLRYEATCNPEALAGASAFPTSLEVEVPVTMGLDYTCTVAAVNAVGTSASSAPMTVSTIGLAINRIRAMSVNPARPGSTVHYNVQFNYPVDGVDASDFQLATSGLTGAGITLVFGSGTDWYVDVFTGTGIGSVRIDLVDDDTIVDTSGGVLFGAGTGIVSNGETFFIDNLPSAPKVRTAVGGDSQITVSFDAPDSDGGLPIIDYLATCQAPPPYPMGSARGTDSPIVVPVVNGRSYLCAVTAYNANGPGITSTPPVGANTLLTSVSGIKRASADPAYGATVDYTVTFTNPVSGVDATDFAVVTTGSIAGASIVGVTGSGATYTVTVNRGTGTGTLRLDLVEDQSIFDASAPLAVVGGIVNGETYTILNAPSVNSITAVGPTTTAAATVQYTVTFSGAVSGVDVTDFSLATTGTIAGASIASVSGAGDAWLVTVNSGTGSGTIRLDLVDDDSISDGTPLGGPGAGNGNAQGAVFTIDRGTPVVLSLVIVGGTPAGPVAGGTVITYEVTFSRAVFNVDASDFTPVTTGTAVAAAGAVTGSGTVYRIAYTVTGTGTVRVDVVDDDSIADALGNKLGGTGNGNGGFTTGPTVTVDGTAPVVSSIVRTGAATVTSGSSVGFTVTFSKAVTGVDTGDFTLVPTGTAAGSITGISGSGTTYTVTVLASAAGGTLRLDLVDNDSIVDAVLNALGGAGPGNGTFAAGQAYTVVAPDRVITGTSPTGTGPITATFTGGGAGCTFASAQFIPLTGNPASPPAGSAPATVTFAHGLFDFSTASCTVGSTITVTVTYPTRPRGGQYWKYGRTPTSAGASVWYLLPSTVSGNSVIFSITDGGLGDDDLAANGTISDPGGIGLPLFLPDVPVPTLSQWALMLLGLMMMGFAMRRLR